MKNNMEGGSGNVTQCLIPGEMVLQITCKDDIWETLVIGWNKDGGT